MNLLVTTLGTSWQIVPELIGFTNPKTFNFFQDNSEAIALRRAEQIQPVHACWIVTTEGNKDLEKLGNWARLYSMPLTVIVAKGINHFSTPQEVLLMRSLIYKVVLNAKDISSKLYLSLSGGRKTMSADMQEAGNLFGCTAMFHIVDKTGIPRDMMNELFQKDYNFHHANSFMPLVIEHNIRSSSVVSGSENPIRQKDYPLHITCNENSFSIMYYEEDGKLGTEITDRKEQSSQLYANFYSKISDLQRGRDIFRKLYFLPPFILKTIQKTKVKNNKTAHKLIALFPKAELHSHLGGVLLPSEIIEVALTVRNHYFKSPIRTDLSINDIFRLKYKDFNLFYENLIAYICQFENRKTEFESLIYDQYSDDTLFYRIGIDKYQSLGNFQGSSLLQCEIAIKKTLEIYSQKIKSDNIQYLELRCSPQKYTKLGLPVKKIIDIIIDVLDKTGIEYRLLYIIGRENSLSEINKEIEIILHLLKENSLFSKRFAGIDLAGNENKGDPETLRESFMPLLKDCFHLTIHAGETESVASIWKAVYHLSAERIGHGLTLIDNIELLNHFINRNIGVEMCPSSNNQIVGFHDRIYPLVQYLKQGLKVCLNTDDCGISKTTLTREFLLAADLCPELSLWDVIVLIRNSISMAFVDTITKNSLMKQFESIILNIIEENFNENMLY